MKIAPLYHILKREGCAHPVIVHTGQHYDLNISDALFQDLRLSEPDIHFSLGSNAHAEQTDQVMIAYEKVLLEDKPDLVIVVGDVNSTLSCALVASKIEYPMTESPNNSMTPHMSRPLVTHVGAGLRSFDRSMPEEINRILTDAIADLLFTIEESANKNLRLEGIPEDRIHFVGNIMIDTLLKHKQKAQSSDILEGFGLIDASTDNKLLCPNPPLPIQR